LIITRYIIREISYTLIALMGLILLIYISHRFMVYLVQASVGNLPAEFIFQLLGLKLLSDLMLILPLGFFLAILLALGRLYKDNEITAMASCGIPVPFFSILSLGGFFAIIIATLSLLLAPWAQSQKEVLQTKLTSLAEVGGIAAGRFKEFNHGNGIFYIESMDSDSNLMHNLFVQVNLPDKRVIIVADQGYQVVQGDELLMVLVNGHRYENKLGQLNYVITDFEQHTIKVPKRLDTPQDENSAAIPTGLLWGQPEAAYQAELQWRLSLPLTAILLAALAVPLSRTTPRQGQYAKIFSGILIYLIYTNLLNIAKKWVDRGDLSPSVGVWWVHLGLVAIILVLFYWPSLKIQIEKLSQHFSKQLDRLLNYLKN